MTQDAYEDISPFPPLIQPGDTVRLDEPYSPGLDSAPQCTNGIITAVIETQQPRELPDPAFANVVASADGLIPTRVEVALFRPQKHENTPNDPPSEATLPIVPQQSDTTESGWTFRPHVADFHVQKLTLIERGGGAYQTIDAHLGDLLEHGYDAPYFD